MVYSKRPKPKASQKPLGLVFHVHVYNNDGV